MADAGPRLAEEPNMSISRTQTIWALGGVGAVALTAGLVAVVVAARPKVERSLPEAQGRTELHDSEDHATLVKATRPRKDASLRISVRQLLNVEAFFETDIRAQVAGVVSQVPKSLGAPVRAGELLAEIAVPDLDQEVLQKQAVIQQRLKDVEAARAQVLNAVAQIAVATETVEQRRAEVSQAIETREYRKQLYERFVEAAKGKGVSMNLVEEEKRNYLSAYYGVSAAEAAVRKALADVKEKESNLTAARADVELKETLVDVARKDHARAQAVAGYARITAPYDGVVIDNRIGVGDFVQNASTGQTRPLMTLARSDIVTVVMKVPDNAAPFVTRDTEALLRFDELPNLRIRARLTRFSPSIRNKDRTLRVEVDLWNDTPEKYREFRAKCVSTWLSSLAATGPLELPALLTASDESWRKNSKARSDPFPILPTAVERSAEPLTILPGTSGYMRLLLQQFRGAYLLPSSAVYSLGGKHYILEVRGGRSHQVPVRVQINDGKMAKVAVIVQEADPAHGKAEMHRDLTGDEVVILNRQVQIGDGQPVEVSFDD
jgi:multidrug resistance efflux pump